MSDSMVERVARALAWHGLTQHGTIVCRWPDDWSQVDADRYRIQARAAIEAMTEPTPWMIVGGNSQLPVRGEHLVWTDERTTRLYTAMITAALEEKK